LRGKSGLNRAAADFFSLFRMAMALFGSPRSHAQ